MKSMQFGPLLSSMAQSLSVIVLLALLGACNNEEPKAYMEEDLASMSWAEIETAARGATVTHMMWTGDPLINQYMQGFVKL